MKRYGGPDRNGVLPGHGARIAGLALCALLVLALGCSRTQPRGSGMTPVEFRDRVMEALATEFPDRKVETTANPEVLKCGSAELSLQNLRAKFETGEDQTDEALRKLVKEHFTPGFAALDAASAPPLRWEEARKLLRPQLMPAEYLERHPLAHKAFGEGLVQGFVVDRPDSYAYVLAEDVKRWGLTLDELDRVALENLDAVSKEIPLKESEGTEPFLSVGRRDGYDAARLLSPRFRERAAAKLGSPFLAAVPNRDFLILWPAKASPELQARARRQAALDTQGQPYPLTATVFEVTPASIRPVRD